MSYKNLLSVCAVVLLAGCASSSMLMVRWSDPKLRTPATLNMLVVSITKENAPRRIWEDIFVEVLQKHHIRCIASYQLFGDVIPTTNQVLEAVARQGFDTVLITHRLPVETNTVTTPGYTTFEPDYVMNDHRYQYSRYWPVWASRYYDYQGYLPQYYTHYSEVEHEGTTLERKYHLKRVDVWTTGTTGKLIYSATTRSLEPDSAGVDFIRKIRWDVVELIVPDLVRSHILAP